MPFNLAQWTGVAVAAIVVTGSDLDVVYAVPLGLFAGALATFVSALADLYRGIDTTPRPGTRNASSRTASS